MIDELREKIEAYFVGENSGHGYEHACKVEKLAREFAQKEGADEELVATAALLHDVDDYKLVGYEAAGELAQAKRMMAELGVGAEAQEKVLEIIRTMGYSNYMRGVRPESLEGKCVSDADMCEACGVAGMLRCFQFSFMKAGGVIFDRDFFPEVEQSAEHYQEKKDPGKHNTAVNHFFEKMLVIPQIMMTETGRAEAEQRKKIMVDFLREMFREEDAPEWNDYLDKYLAKQEG